MDKEEILESLKILKAEVEWDYPLTCYILLDKVIHIIEESEDPSLIDKKKNF